MLIVLISKPLSAGAYTVHWQAVSVDTNHAQGTFEFTGEALQAVCDLDLSELASVELPRGFGRD